MLGGMSNPPTCAHCDKPLREEEVYLVTRKGERGTETALACSHECADAVVDWGGHQAAAAALPEATARERLLHAQKVHAAREATVGAMSLAFALKEQARLDAEPMGS